MAAQVLEGHESAMTSHNDESKEVESSSSATEKKDLKKFADQPLIVEHEYLTGVKLMLVLASVTVVAFLVLLDMVIITTVRILCHYHVIPWLMIYRPFLISQTTFILFQMWDGMEAHTSLQGEQMTCKIPIFDS
jgi:hypothetical protein